MSADRIAARGPFGHDGPLDYYDGVVAVYDPVMREDLVPGAAACIGLIGRWHAGWIIGEGDSIAYHGQWAMIADPGDASGTQWAAFPFGWAPECDIRRVNEG